MGMFVEELKKMEAQGKPLVPPPQPTAQVIQPAEPPSPPPQAQGGDALFIKGAIIGIALFVVWALIMGVKALMNSESEGSRRIKIVGAIGLTAFLIYGAAVTGNLDGLALISVVIVATVWITKGFSKK